MLIRIEITEAGKLVLPMSDLQACSVLGNIKLVTLMSIKKTERCSRQQRRLESRERERESGQKL